MDRTPDWEVEPKMILFGPGHLLQKSFKVLNNTSSTIHAKIVFDNRRRLIVSPTVFDVPPRSSSTPVNVDISKIKPDPYGSSSFELEV